MLAIRSARLFDGETDQLHARPLVLVDRGQITGVDTSGTNSLREMANCGRKHVGVTDRVPPSVGVSGLWGKCPPKSPNSGRYASRKGRLEEGDQFLGDGFGFEHWGKVTDARQLSDVRVDDVLGHVAFHVGEEGAE